MEWKVWIRLPCVEQWEENQNKEVDFQIREESQWEAFVCDDTPLMVS